MNTTQQNSFKSSQANEPEVPNLFFFILGMILVIGSGASADGQHLNANNEVQTEIMVYKNQKISADKKTKMIAELE